MASDAEHPFMSLGPLYVLLRELSVQVFCQFFNWVVCHPGVDLCEFFTYIGDQTLVWDIISKYVFPYSWISFHFQAVFFSHAVALVMFRRNFSLVTNLCRLVTTRGISNQCNFHTFCIAFVFSQLLCCSEPLKWLKEPKFYSGRILILVGPAGFV